MVHDSTSLELDYLKSGSVIGFDTEFITLDMYNPINELLCISFASRQGQYNEIKTISFTKNELTNDVVEFLNKRILRREDLFFTSHNLKVDIAALRLAGLNKPAKAACTLHITQYYDENIYNKSLDALCRQFNLGSKLDFNINQYLKMFTTETLLNNLSTTLKAYAEEDAKLHLKLFEYLEIFMDLDYFCTASSNSEYRFIQTIEEMEHRGILVDLIETRNRIKQINNYLLEIQNDLGFDPMKPSLLGKYMFETLKLPVLHTTKTGRPSLDKNAMYDYEALSNNHPDLKKVMTYRKLLKTRSTYYEAIEKLNHNSVIHCNFRIQGTKTGRLSCANPNLQQLPRTNDEDHDGLLNVKKVFIPRPNHVLYELDYKNLELRIAAAYAKEVSLLNAFVDNKDIFQEMANDLKVERFVAKTLTYAILYGAGANRVNLLLDCGEDKAKELITKFYNTYPMLYKLKQDVSDRIIEQGYITTLGGRRRYLTAEESYKAFNSLIQGSAADIVKNVMINISDSNLPGLLLQIHDALVVEIRKDFIDTDLAAFRDKMINPCINIPIPLEVDIHEWSSK